MSVGWLKIEYKKVVIPIMFGIGKGENLIGETQTRIFRKQRSYNDKTIILQKQKIR